ncbi:MAG: hypothetical protein HN712_01470 [Gemmatimonadetes bacterium]|jgi:hypothetical protein|nr:hypothetical protein [Gemmatimonadota bacterium]MBT7858942.1 hypothetical protein [Gemmatimonadota bacterium]
MQRRSTRLLDFRGWHVQARGHRAHGPGAVSIRRLGSWGLRGICIALLALTARTAAATTVDGRISASAYAYEASPTDSTDSAHLRTYTAIRLKISDLGDRRLSLNTYLRATTDLRDRAGDDPALRPVSTYLRFKDDAVDLRVGRQYVYAGVGYGQVDGLRADVRHAGFRLTLHGGALVPAYGEPGVGSLSDAHLWGLRLSTSRFAGVDLAVSYADRARDPLAYDSAGIYSGFIGQPDAARRQLAGVEVRRRFGAHNLRGRLDFDMQRSILHRAEVGARIALKPTLAVSVDWLRREPSLFSSSILSVFAAEGFDEVTLRLHYRIRDDLTLSAHTATVLYDTEDSQRLGVSASFGRHLTIGYNRSQGYAGVNDGLNGSMLVPLSTKLMLRGQLGLASYERIANDDREGLLSGVAALTYRASRQLSIDGQLQALRNPTYNSDLRLLLRASWRFRS